MFTRRCIWRTLVLLTSLTREDNPDDWDWTERVAQNLEVGSTTVLPQDTSSSRGHGRTSYPLYRATAT